MPSTTIRLTPSAASRIFPARWWGIGAAYRRHMNQQDAGHFNARLQYGSANLSACLSRSRNRHRPGQRYGDDDGFHGSSSDDPNGFIFQFWPAIATRTPPPPNQAPTVSVSASSASITLPCPEGTSSDYLHGKCQPLGRPDCQRKRSG